MAAGPLGSRPLSNSGLSPRVEATLVACFFTILGIVSTWPLARHLGDVIPGDLGDPLLNAWILGWDADRLKHGLKGLWDAPNFYPYLRTLAFSEHLLGIAVWTAPLVWLRGGSPIAAYNVAVIASFPLAGGGAYLLLLGGSAYYLVGGIAVALAGWWTWRGEARGGWLYGLFLAATMGWALWETGLDAWQLTARIFGPAVIGILFALPPVRRPLGRGGNAAALIALAGVALVSASHLRSPMEIAAQGAAVREQLAIAGNPGEWRVWGRDDGGTRFSPVSQITPENVSKLKLAWQFDTGIDPMSQPTPSPMQTTPLMVDGKLFFCTQTNVVFALDPDSGKQAWRFDPKVDPAGGSVVRTCRGVAYHDGAPGLADGTAPFCARKIITATYGAQLIALDSQTGRPCPGFGNAGFVNLKDGLGEVATGYYYVSSAPGIVRDTIVVGGWVADNVSTDEPSGVIRGFDVATGKLRWA